MDTFAQIFSDMYFKTLVISILLITITYPSWGFAKIRGKVVDADTKEEIIGAAVFQKDNPSNGAVTGLDGTFSMTCDEESILVCSYIGYEDMEIKADGDEITICLCKDEMLLKTAVVTAENHGRTESGARTLEKNALNVVNVLSAKAIELSPDMTVGNAIQRMSGVTMERNGSGEGQYAILRGMDKRYNYTLVNGIKISSPDNKNRFVPLDIFPSEMLERLEVSKSLTADMEGDGIGGAINLVMKDAPDRMMLSANLATGYNSLFFKRDFQSFRYKDIVRSSPYELSGMDEDYAVSEKDFTMSNLHMKWSRPMPDIVGNLSFGNRFFGNRLGLLVSASYQHLYRGKDSYLYYQPGTSHYGTETRTYSEEQGRLGTHVKMDYRINSRNKVMFYTGYTDLQSAEVKDSGDEKERTVRMKWNRQYILNGTLKGEHSFLESGNLKLDWSGAFSKAGNQTPDNTEIHMLGNHICTSDAAERRWEHNSDTDAAIYLNLSYDIGFGNGSTLLVSTGGMFRDKIRDSFFNSYTFNSSTGPKDPQYLGEDWNNFDEILITPDRFGNIGDPLNYDASEEIGACYLSGKYTAGKAELIAGIRMEHTNQGYKLKFPRESDPEGYQSYYDFLPDLHLKYGIHKNANLRFSYYRALNRPGFFEIVPYTIINEDYNETGNPELKHTVADNLDLRYEFFPRSSEQLMIGLFWKKINDPIEYGLITEGQTTLFKPMNFGDADNLGLEIDILKYFKWFGIKANYTFTHSKMTTVKKTMQESEVISVMQSRPLYGQAGHVANLSLLFKSQKAGVEGQISGSYTGKRLSEISEWLDDDIWEAEYIRLDASVEKQFGNGVGIFAKASNIVNSPLLRYIQSGAHTANVTDTPRYAGNVIERKEWNYQSVIIGIRFKMN